MSKKILTSAIFTSFIFAATAFGQQVPNGSFETWGPGAPLGETEPSGWTSGNVLSTSFTGNSPVSVTQNTTPADVKSGKSSMQIVTTAPSQTSLNDIGASNLPNGTLDFAFTGSVTGSSPYFKEGYAEVNRYAALNFYAIYSIGGGQSGDNGTCGVLLFKTKGKVIDTIAYGGVLIQPSATYQPYVINLTYKSGQAPDSAVVVFTSSGTKTQAVLGSTLIVDSVTFTGLIAGINEYNLLSTNISAYPNPASENITLKSSSAIQNFSFVEIYDITGRKTDADVVNSNQVVINTGGYTRGLYVYKAFNENHELTGIGKFTVLK